MSYANGLVYITPTNYASKINKKHFYLSLSHTIKNSIKNVIVAKKKASVQSYLQI
jgi:hypothetical protein